MNHIRTIREKRGMTQVELASRIGVSQPYIHDLELDNRKGRTETWQRIADALGCTVGELKDKDELRAT